MIVAGLGAALSSGCAENRSSVYIVGILAPTDECRFTASLDTERRTLGGMCAGDQSYFAAVMVANQLTKLSDPSTLKTETNVFQIEGVEVNVLNADGSSAGAAYSATISETIPAANGGVPGLAALALPLVDGVSIGIGETLISEFRVFGSSLGGLDIQTGWYRFPILGVRCECETSQEPNFCNSEFLGCTDI
jgi:hypothetical protein